MVHIYTHSASLHQHVCVEDHAADLPRAHRECATNTQHTHSQVCVCGLVCIIEPVCIVDDIKTQAHTSTINTHVNTYLIPCTPRVRRTRQYVRGLLGRFMVPNNATAATGAATTAANPSATAPSATAAAAPSAIAAALSAAAITSANIPAANIPSANIPSANIPQATTDDPAILRFLANQHAAAAARANQELSPRSRANQQALAATLASFHAVSARARQAHEEATRRFIQAARGRPLVEILNELHAQNIAQHNAQQEHANRQHNVDMQLNQPASSSTTVDMPFMNELVHLAQHRNRRPHVPGLRRPPHGAPLPARQAFVPPRYHPTIATTTTTTVAAAAGGDDGDDEDDDDDGEREEEERVHTANEP